MPEGNLHFNYVVLGREKKKREKSTKWELLVLISTKHVLLFFAISVYNWEVVWQKHFNVINYIFVLSKFLYIVRVHVIVTGLPCKAGLLGSERDYPAFKENTK